uniref:Uncharacterized protein n=1 Tax=Rhizophora mucronata TaxID=61149 RepID=A0A2P2IZ64_RHIMU
MFVLSVTPLDFLSNSEPIEESRPFRDETSLTNLSFPFSSLLYLLLSLGTLPPTS